MIEYVKFWFSRQVLEAVETIGILAVIVLCAWLLKRPEKNARHNK